VVQLKLKMSDFTLLTRQTTLATPTDDGQAIYQTAAKLLAGERLTGKVRLVGVSVHGLGGEGGQLSLFGSDRRTSQLNRTLDRIADKFGDGKITTADLAGTKRRR
jgi:DNA polymerase-4